MTSRRALRLARAAAALGAAVGCTPAQAPVVAGHCPSTNVSALTNGSDQPTVPLTAGTRAAIGALESPDDGALVCTGTFIGDGWIVTARHCANPASFNGLRFRTARDSVALEALAAEYHPHPALDVMLVRIPPSPALVALGLDALAPWDPAETREWAGQTVTLAGYGKRADGGAGRLQFLEETVVSVSSDAIVVDGGAEHGACAGDSGGPLLAQSADGTVRFLGILDNGSSTCRGRDLYLPAAAFAAWMSEVRAAAVRDPCGGLDAEGTCDQGLARWCAGSYLDSQRCQGDTLCGWDAAASGYRCVASDLDPCLGAGPAGRCDGDVLHVCRQGTLVETDCGACGLGCAADADGHAGCR